MPFTQRHLLISQDEIDKITDALANEDHPQPILDTIEEQTAKVEGYTNRYLVPEARLNRLTRSLVLYQLYALIGDLSDARKDDYKNAMRELEDIRDGKFADLALASNPPQPLPSGGGRWGSAAKLRFPSDQ